MDWRPDFGAKHQGMINACSLKLVSTIQIDGAPTGLFPAKAGPTKKQRV